jgi:hypothetical protein
VEEVADIGAAPAIVPASSESALGIVLTAAPEETTPVTSNSAGNGAAAAAADAAAITNAKERDVRCGTEPPAKRPAIGVFLGRAENTAPMAFQSE